VPPIRVIAGTRRILVRADPGRLEQVFLNLLANAIEHAPGSAVISVTIKSSARHAEVSVADQGAGIAARDLRTIFEAYTRVGQPRAAPGLGLGLYVAREIVTAHGGEIKAASRPGKGTVMTVRLPLADRTPPQESPEPGGSEPGSPDAGAAT
jgi:two-component system sensor histidine kinase MtrB